VQSTFVHTCKWFLTCCKIVWHGASGFTSPTKKCVLQILTDLKYLLSWPSFNPQTLSPLASILAITPQWHAARTNPCNRNLTWCAKCLIRELCRAVHVKGNLPWHELLIRVWTCYTAPATDPTLKGRVLRTHTRMVGPHWNRIPFMSPNLFP
jgi:hypothetical protein